MLFRNVKVSFAQWRYYCKPAFKDKVIPKAARWESVIGLEVHAQINSKSKLFSASATEFAAPINSQVSFFDTALPGTLPVLNKKCVEAAVMTSVALNCHINMRSKFDRKHYFYADLPAGYQITQQRLPIATEGFLCFPTADPVKKNSFTNHKVRITQVQLEQDSGKSLHDLESKISLIDLNRAGMGLMEIVTEPDFRSAQEAADFVRELQLILTTLGTCDGKMAEGSLRVDASVSLRRPNGPLGVRAEVKNLNSIRFVAKAIEYEIRRQAEILDNGEEVQNETRSFDFETEMTIAMRDKEKVHDYRFLPEPNLPPLVLYNDSNLPKSQVGERVNVDAIKRNMPELPETTRQRLQQDYSLTMQQSLLLINERPLMDFFLGVVHLQSSKNPKKVLNFVLNDLLGLLNKKDIDIETCPISHGAIAELLELLENDIIASNTSKKVLEELFNGATSPTEVVEAKRWTLVKDTSVLANLCDDVINSNSDTVKSYLKGKEKVFKFLMGQLQKESRGRADLRKGSQILKEKLEQLRNQ